MSSYEYYEFRTLDRTLSRKEMQDLEQHSSRAEITPRSFSVTYNYSSFRGDPTAILAKHFDCYLYVSSWCYRELGIRVPAATFRPELVEPYLAEDAVTCERHGDHFIIHLAYRPQEESEWAFGEGYMDTLLPVRSALLHGDIRPLYLGWLAGVASWSVDGDFTEPPIPPGLVGWQSTYISDLREFLFIPKRLLDAGAERSAAMPDHREIRKRVQSYVEDLDAGQRDHLLTELILEQQPARRAALFADAVGQLSEVTPAHPPRTAEDLRKHLESR